MHPPQLSVLPTANAEDAASVSERIAVLRTRDFFIAASKVLRTTRRKWDLVNRELIEESAHHHLSGSRTDPR
jgi:hypothetical protein